MKIRPCTYKIIVVLVIGLLMLNVFGVAVGNPIPEGDQS